ncbi:MAG: PEP-CTERM sorting domain-containing protein [Kamptonema sp. SIO4C4]|nr:PEP-CTERM sorting domain-containing protein [Kamptonema sp. SIO4C4]
MIGTSDRASAYRIFFGEDLNDSFTDPLLTYPNASQAEQDFLTNLNNPITETFEGFQDQTNSPLTLNFGLTGTAQLQGNGFIQQLPPGTTNGFGSYPISGEKYWETNVAQNSLTLEFSKPVAAVGFYGVDVGNFGGNLQLNLTRTDGTTTTLKVPNTLGSFPSNPTQGSVLFFGFIAENPAELLASMSFNMMSVSSDPFGFDNLTLSGFNQVKPPDPPHPIPEPSHWLSLLIVGGCLTFISGKRR